MTGLAILLSAIVALLLGFCISYGFNRGNNSSDRFLGVWGMSAILLFFLLFWAFNGIMEEDFGQKGHISQQSR